MTTASRDGADSPFGDWIRNRPDLDSVRQRLSVMDTDYWIHQYRAHEDRRGVRAIDSIMLVELKTHWRDVPFAQDDTLTLVDQLLRLACAKAGGKRGYIKFGLRTGETRRVRCFGVHRLKLSGTRPDDSKKIWWDKWSLPDPDVLAQVLRFERDPDHPIDPLEFRRHHKSPRAANLQLFDPNNLEQRDG